MWEGHAKEVLSFDAAGCQAAGNFLLEHAVDQENGHKEDHTGSAGNTPIHTNAVAVLTCRILMATVTLFLSVRNIRP